MRPWPPALLVDYGDNGDRNGGSAARHGTFYSRDAIESWSMLYELDERGTATFLGIHEYADDEPLAAPLGSEDPRWAITFPDSFPDDVTWGYFMTDGNYDEHYYDYTSTTDGWSQWPGMDGPCFSVPRTSPMPT